MEKIKLELPSTEEIHTKTKERLNEVWKALEATVPETNGNGNGTQHKPA